MPETYFAIRRADGEPMGDYSFWIVPDPDDWTPATDEAAGEAIEYEMVQLDVVVLERRKLPLCSDCNEPAQFWGLCEAHAREDDPEYFEMYHVIQPNPTEEQP